MNRNIACVGARTTPLPILSWMEETGAKLASAGYMIASGNAPGADQAWARGANRVEPARVFLYLPWDDFERAAVHVGNKVRVFNPKNHQRFVEAAGVVASLHGSSGRIALLARDAMIVEGAHCVLGYLGAGSGGTMHTFRLAQRQHIITMNVGDALVRAGIEERLAAGLDVRGPAFDTGKGRKW